MPKQTIAQSLIEGLLTLGYAGKIRNNPPMKTNPQIIVTFSPTGTLQAEIPGQNGARQVVPLPPDQCHSALTRLLKGQALTIAHEAWVVLQASRNHRTYDDQLDKLMESRHKAKKAKARLALIESQIGPTKPTKSTKSSKPKSYNSPLLAGLFNDL